LLDVAGFRGGFIMAECPECGAQVEAENVEQGEIVPCPECGADLEVLSVNPTTLGLAPEEGEDWGE
jgi:alpha-aminoadipate carrier protein LysW